MAKEIILFNTCTMHLIIHLLITSDATAGSRFSDVVYLIFTVYSHCNFSIYFQKTTYVGNEVLMWSIWANLAVYFCDIYFIIFWLGNFKKNKTLYNWECRKKFFVVVVESESVDRTTEPTDAIEMTQEKRGFVSQKISLLLMGSFFHALLGIFLCMFL